MKSRLTLPRVATILIFSFFYFLFIPSAYSSGPESQVIKGSVKEGDTFSHSLLGKKISLPWIKLIVSKLNRFIDFKTIKGGTYQIIMDEQGELVQFIFEISPTEIYKIEKTLGGEYIAQKKEPLLETYLVKVEEEIRYSLYHSMKKAGEGNGLVLAFGEALAWRIDFSRDVRKGDRFKVLVEKLYKGDQFIRYGAIHALEYRSGNKVVRGIRFKNHFYDERGNSLGKTFLKEPLRFHYISSGFNRNRKHPIMGGIHPHFGIDYAAPIGTPVWAVADGIVVSCGSVEGFGKQVVLRHPNGYMSYYSHLSKYGPGMKVGKRVEQKQIIGYVGSTGFSTGPHLDYRLSKNSQFIDSQKETFPSGKPIEQKEKEAFAKKKDEVMAWLNDEPPFKRRLKENR